MFHSVGFVGDSIAMFRRCTTPTVNGVTKLECERTEDPDRLFPSSLPVHGEFTVLFAYFYTSHYYSLAGSRGLLLPG